MTNKRTRERQRARRVQLALDGASYTVTVTAAEDQRLRLALAPYVARARVVEGDSAMSGGQLQAAMRSARLRSLLHLPEEQPGDTHLIEEFKKLVDSAAEIYARSLGEQTAVTYRRGLRSHTTPRSALGPPARTGTAVEWGRQAPEPGEHRLFT